MAKRRKTLPARKPRDRSRDDDSLLLRSAESLGRVIGALQRQLDAATKRFSPPDTVTTGAKRRSRKTSKPATAKKTTRSGARGPGKASSGSKKTKRR